MRRWRAAWETDATWVQGRLAEATHTARVPWFAICGIDADTIIAVVAAGASRVAMVGTIGSARGPQAAARGLPEQLRVRQATIA